MDEAQVVDVKNNKVQTVLKILIALVVGFVVAPFIFLAIKGLIGLAIAAVVGLAAIQLAPWISMKLDNLRMKLITGEAATNPIETMKNLYIEKYKELQEADQKIINFEAEVGNYDDKMRLFNKQYPEEAPKFQEISTKMHEGLAEMKDEQSDARAKLKDFAQRINKAEAIYKMSLAAAQVTAFSRSAEQEVFAKIKEQVAFDSVQTELNRSFASLDMALAKRKEEHLQLPAGATT